MKKLNQKGFTLIELMIVVVIIGILASIAIPQFLKYQLKSKTSEASRNLGAIRTNEEAFYAKWASYVKTMAYPRAMAGGAADALKAPWAGVFDGDVGFALMGFASQGAVFFSYGVADSALTPEVVLSTSCALAPAAANSAIDASDPMNPVINPTIGRSTAVPPANVITPLATGNVDGDAIIVCYQTGNESTNIIGSPPDASENVF